MPLPDPTSCHHCHIHAPIPARELKRTHPLRSHFPEEEEEEEEQEEKKKKKRTPAPLRGESSFRKNVSFLYRKISRRSAAQKRQPLPLPPPLPPPRALDDRPAVVVDSLPLPPPPLPPGFPEASGRRRRGLAGLQAVLLVGAYALLLVLAVVIGVVLSQVAVRRPGSQPRLLGPGRPLPPPRPVFQDASSSAHPSPRAPRPRLPPRVLSSAAPPRPRPSAPPPQRGAAPAPPPPPPPPSLKDLDFDYYDDLEVTVLPNPVSRPAPSPPTFRPVAAQASERRSPAPSARRSQPQPQPLAEAERGFDPKAEERPVRGRKEPDVKILRSWSHHNADGTFSWGYYNADGSFKNETRGLDCVVRGVYGYVVKETGEQLSFPYESGNPCDPDAPDYYYDYDADPSLYSDVPEARSPLAGGASSSLPRRQG